MAFSLNSDDQIIKNMKIGVVTFYGTADNYGQVLQCYALIRVLQKMGHIPFLIKYTKLETADRPVRKFVRNILNFVRTSFRKKASSDQSENSLPAKERKILFDNFYQKYIPSVGPYSLRECRKKLNDFDCFISGSDQIWGWNVPFFYLAFVEDKPKLSYASSLGGFTECNAHARKNMTFWMKSYLHISVREESGIKACKYLGRDDAVVLSDPTLLLTTQEWRQLYPGNVEGKKQNYILIYWLGNETAFGVEEVLSFASEQRIPIKYIAAQRNKKMADAQIYPGIEEWLSLYDNASYVITNSFHGTVFSLIMEKPFLVVPLTGQHERMNARLTTLLGQLGLKDRICGSPDELVKLKETLQPALYKEKLENFRRHSFQTLNNWLDEIQEKQITK